MGTKFENRRGKDLYAFWKETITNSLKEELQADDGVLLNLASNEYFKAVDHKNLNARIITPQFKDWKNGQYKMISFYAKKARGMMAAYVIQNKLTNPEDVQNFDTDGYAFNEELSSGDNWVFTRG